MKKSPVSFRGTKSGLIVLFDEKARFDEIISGLKKKLDDSGYFFVGASVDLVTGELDFTKRELLEIRDLLKAQHGLQVNSIKTKSVLTQKNARELNWEVIEIEEPKEDRQKEKAPSIKTDKKNAPAEPDRVLKKGELPTKIYKHNLRSGQVLEYDGNLVILGDVNPGAEVIASGDIIVFGALRGLAFAGASGNENSIILAARLHPTQIRIANKLARSDEDTESPDFPEIASIDGNRIIIETWSKKSF